MTIKIGIATSDPRIAALVFREMTSSTDVWTYNEFPEVAIYGSHRNEPHAINGSGAVHHVNERSSVLAKLDVEIALMPDIAVQQVINNKNLANTIPIVIPPSSLPIITSEMLDGIEQNLYDQKPPRPKAKREQYEKVMELIQGWGNLARESALGIADKVVDRSSNQFRETALQAILSGKKEDVPLVAISGGVTPWSTAESLMYSSFNYNNALIALSASKTPNPVPRAEEDALTKVPNENTLSPLPKLLETNKLLEQTEPTLLIVDCNTVHLYFDRIRESYKKPVVSIIEETIQKLPSGSTALVLGSASTAKSKIYPKTLNKIRPNDGIKIITPDENHQEVVNSALFNDILAGKTVAGGNKLKGVIDHYNKTTKGKLFVIAACTEVGLGLYSLNNKRLNSKIVDSAHVGYDRASEFLQKQGGYVL